MKISVIVPIYNSEEYLPACIESILSQSHTDFELLLIDDGSKDKSGEICDEYGEKDNRIKVFHQPNGGVSSARNVGLENATGEYIIHTDSDDLMLPGALHSLYTEALVSNSDIVVGNYIVRTDKKDNHIDLEEKATSHDFLYDLLMGKYHAGLWNKLIRRSAYNNLTFDEDIGFMEDKLMISRILFSNPSILFIKNEIYVHIQREGSIANELSLQSRLNVEKVILRLENVLKENALFDIPIEKMKLDHKIGLLVNMPNDKLHVTRFSELNTRILKNKWLPLHSRILLWLEFKNIGVFTKLYNLIREFKNSITA